MLTIEKVRKQAETNSRQRDDIIKEMKLRVMNFAANNRNWEYDSVNKQFSQHLGAVTGKSQFVYTPIEHSSAGLQLIAYYESENKCLYGKCIISQTDEDSWVSELYKKLSEKRMELLSKWKREVRAYAIELFEQNKDEYCKYPTLHYSGIFTKSMYLWTCGGKGTKIDEEAQRKIGCLNNTGMEWFENYSPSFWDNDEQTDVDVNLGDGIIMHLHREYPLNRSFAYDWPDIWVQFEMTNTEDSAFTAALSAIKWYNNAKKYGEYDDFEDHMENAEWFMNENDKASAVIPIIDEQNAEYILKKAEKTFSKYFNFEICKKEISLFNHESTCIKVTEK